MALKRTFYTVDLKHLNPVKSVCVARPDQSQLYIYNAGISATYSF